MEPNRLRFELASSIVSAGPLDAHDAIALAFPKIATPQALFLRIIDCAGFGDGLRVEDLPHAA